MTEHLPERPLTSRKTRREVLALVGLAGATSLLGAKNINLRTLRAMQEKKQREREHFEATSILPTLPTEPSKNGWSLRLVPEDECSLYADPYGGQVKIRAGENYVIARNTFDRLFHGGFDIRLEAYITLAHQSVGKFTFIGNGDKSYLLPHESGDIIELVNEKKHQDEVYRVERNPEDQDKFWFVRLMPTHVPGLS